MMRRSSDPEIRRSASKGVVSIESVDEAAARDAVTVSSDGVQQITSGQSKSMQSLRNGDAVAIGNGQLLNGSLKSLRELEQDAVELTPLTGTGGPSGGGSGSALAAVKAASDSTISLPNRVRAAIHIRSLYIIPQCACLAVDFMLSISHGGLGFVTMLPVFRAVHIPIRNFIPI